MLFDLQLFLRPDWPFIVSMRLLNKSHGTYHVQIRICTYFAVNVFYICTTYLDVDGYEIHCGFVFRIQTVQ